MLHQQLACVFAPSPELSCNFKRTRFATKLPSASASGAPEDNPLLNRPSRGCAWADKRRSIDLGPELFESKMTATTAFKPLSKEDLADVLGVCIRTIDNWVNEGILPASTKLGGRAYWHPNTFYAWLHRRLLAEEALVEVLKESASEPLSSRTKSKACSKSSPAKTELDKVRNRTQAQLDALMA